MVSGLWADDVTLDSPVFSRIIKTIEPQTAVTEKSRPVEANREVRGAD